METGNLKEKQEQSVVLTKTMLIQKKEENTRQWNVFILQTLLIFGIAATLFSIVSEGFLITTSKPIVYGMLFLSAGFWSFYYEMQPQQQRYSIKTAAVLMVSLLLVFISGRWFIPSLIRVANDMMRQINKAYNGSLNLLDGEGISGTYAIIVIFFWTVFVLARSIQKYQDDLPVLLIILPVVTASLLGGGKLSGFSLFLLLLILLVIIAGSSTHMRKRFWGGDKQEQVDKNKRVSSRIRYRLGILGMAAGTLLLAVSMYVLSPGLRQPIAMLSDASSPIKARGMQVLYDFLPRISGGKLSFTLEGVGGGVAAGELGTVSGVAYETREALRITCDHAPEETVYLKGFVGTEYTGSRWIARDTEDFENAASNWQIEEKASIYIQNLPFLRMMYAAKELSENVDLSFNQIQVEPLDANVSFTYVPYQAYLNDYYDIDGGDCGVKGQTLQDDIYSWYSVKGYQSLMSRWREEKEKNSVLDEISTNYESYVTEFDTQVDKEKYSGLWELCREEKEDWDKKFAQEMTEEQIRLLEQEKYDKVKNFIVKTLWSNCNFMLESWKLPEDKDYVTYFFFDKKSGDSTAFASTAVLLYRMFDIPARYVVGYAAPANLFSTTSDGKCSAILQSDNAHAWVEIYVPENGWMPVETTPGFEGTVTNMEVAEEDLPKPEESKEVKKDEDNTQKEQETVTMLKMRVFTFVVTILILILIFLGRNRYLYRKHRGMIGKLSTIERVQTIFRSFYEVLLFLGFPENIDTTEKQFTDTLKKWYPSIGNIKLEQFMDLVLSANYGNVQVSKEQTAMALEIYEALVSIAKAQVKGKRKLIFLLWKSF